MLSIQRAVVIIAALGLANVALSADPTHTSATPSQYDKTDKTDKNDVSRAGETMSDAQIANNLAMIDQAEIDAARYVVNKSTNADVKKLAQQRDDDFSAALKKTQDWMKKNNVTQTTASQPAGSAQAPASSQVPASSSQTPASSQTPSTSGTSSAPMGGQYDASSHTPTSGGASNPTSATIPSTTPDSYGAKTPDPANPEYGSTGQTTGQEPPMHDQRQCPPGMYLAMDHCQPTTPNTQGQGGMYGNNNNDADAPASPTPGYGNQGSTNPMPSAAPSDLGKSAQDELAQLRSLTGIELDRRYVSAVINDDQRLLDTIDTRYLVQAKDGDLKTLVKDTRSKVASDLDAARRVQTNMVEKPRTSGTAENDAVDPNALNQ